MDADILNGEGSARTAIQVVVRLRPLIARELRNGSAIAWKWNERTVELRDDAVVEQSYAAAQGRQTHSFTFDRVFAPAALTRALYDAALVDTVTSVMDGFHASVFCYGQTSSGKTHTVQGSDGIDHLASRGRQLDAGVGIDAAWDAGLIELSLRSIFDYIASHQEREFLLRVSYLEVYNEQVNDLLVPSSTNLQLFDDTRRGCVINGLLEEVVASRSRIVELIAAGEAHRHVGQTDFNLKSSRSHTIFRMVVESKLKRTAPRRADEPRPAVRVSTLCLTDLAGSESLRGSKALGDTASGFVDLADSSYRKARQREGAFINKSLLTLSHVICMLSDLELERARRTRAGDAPLLDVGHLPLRNSKLTRILSSSLQGNARVAIVANCSPATGNMDETISTLKFASRAKRIKNTARVNEVLDNKALLARYKLEIRQLRSKLSHFESGAATAPRAGVSIPANTAVIVEHRAQAEAEQRQLEHMIDRLNAVILNSAAMCGDGSDVAAVPPATPGTKGAEAGGSFGEEGEEESRQAESRAEAGSPTSHSWDGLGLGGPRLVSPSKSGRDDDSTSDREELGMNAQRELGRIKEQLSLLLHRRRKHVEAATATSPTKSKSKSKKKKKKKKDEKRSASSERDASSASVPGSSASESASAPATPPTAMQQTIDELERRCEKDRLSYTMSRADNQFLQSQLDERDRLLDTCADVIEQLMQKQGGLEQENERLRFILSSREAEVAALKGTTLEDEEF